MTCRVRFYLDDLNFHYGVAKKTGLRWLDLEALFRDILSQKLEQQVSVEKLTVFTATVSGDAKKRQQTYFGALKEHSECTVFRLGKMKEVTKEGPLKESQDPHIDTCIKESQSPLIATIYKPEEKQTDVNIAVSIVHDAHMVKTSKEFDMACLISNDSDLSAALEVVTKELKQDIALIAPINPFDGIADDRIAVSLVKHIPKNMRVPRIDQSLLWKHRLPEQAGKFRAPKGWLEFRAPKGWLGP